MPARFARLLLVLLAALALGCASAAADPFQFQDLTDCCTLAGTNTTFYGAYLASAVNDNGDVVGTGYGSDGYEHAYLLKNGQFTLLGILSTDSTHETPFSSATDVNNSDVVVGSSSDGYISRNPFGGEHAVTWSYPSTTPKDLGQLQTESINNCNFTSGPLDCYTAGTGINAAGDVVGYGEYLNNSCNWCTYPFVVPAGQTIAPGGDSSSPSASPDMAYYSASNTKYFEASGINATGQIIVSPDPSDANSSDSLGNSSAIYPGDTDVPFNASIHEGVRHPINDSGWVIGVDTSTNLGKVRESSGTIVNLPPLSGDVSSAPAAINNNDDIVGSSTGSNGCPRAVEWPHGNYSSPIDLNAVEPSADENMLYANAISNNGAIVGQGGACSGGSYYANEDPWELIPQELSVSDVTLNEPATSTTATANFTVTLSNPSQNNVTVDYATSDGTATQPTDYTKLNGTLTFSPGQTSKSIPVTVNGTGFFGIRSFTVNLSNPTEAVVLKGTGTGKIVGPSPLKVTLTPTPASPVIQQTASGPTPQSGTVTVTVKNVSTQPITDVTLPSALTIGWHAPASGKTVPVHQTGAPKVLDLGTLQPGQTSSPSTYQTEIDGDGSLDVQALVTGGLQGTTAQALGTTLYQPDSQLLVFTAKLGAKVNSQTHPGLIQAGTSFLINLTLENRSTYRKIIVDPIYPTLDGNAADGSVFPSTVGYTGANPAGSENEVEANPYIALNPGETVHYLAVVRTGASDAADTQTKVSGGTHASVKFDPPTAVILASDNTTSQVAPDHVVMVPGSDDFEVGIDDSGMTAAPWAASDPGTWLDATWSVSKGLSWGLWRATYGAVRGLLWDLPSLVVKGIYNVSTASLDYMDRMVELWTACDDNSACLDDLVDTVTDKILDTYEQAPELLTQSASQLKQQVDQALTSHFAKLEAEWDAGDWRDALTELTAEGTDTAINVALMLGPAVLARSPKAAAAWNTLKTATYAKVGDGLAATVRALEPAKAAFLALSKVVKPGYWFTEEQMASLFGVSERESSLLSAFTKRLGINVVLRSRASQAIKYLEEGLAVMKPYWIKTKNVNQLDVDFLGYTGGTGADSELGKVVFRPPLSQEAVEAKLRAKGVDPSDPEWSEVLSRLKTRTKEYHGEYKQMQKWNKAGKVRGKWPWGENGVNPAVQADTYSTVRFRLNTKGGAVIPEIFEGGKWKFITGDIDLIAITKANGSALSDVEHVSILKQLSNLIGAQHPESATWINDGKFWFKAKKGYLTNEGECCLAQYGPDGKIRAVEFNEKLSDPTSWTKLNYRIFWKGGYEAGPGG
jgi:probable HAF family extracellular repeat protein